MPLVYVTYNKSKPTEWEIVLNKLRKGLCEIVAEALSIPGIRSTGLILKDVELEFREADGHDIGKDLRIVVQAEYLPERAKDHQERTGEITSAIDVLIGEYVTARVYIQLLDIKSADI